ncbi:MAG: endonuclease/exonuclease/phosphatase family protein [Elusimicrobia bacterium]|nr:endonuclease/exonuclease/phosphatase family protein [Elusimicrobiota bacterium]
MSVLLGAAAALAAAGSWSDSASPRTGAGGGAGNTVPAPHVIATYNIHYGVGTDGRGDLGRVAKMILGLDVVGLNEVDVNAKRSGYAHQAAELSRLAGFKHYAYGPAFSSGKRSFGNAILSRKPIAYKKNHPLPRKGDNEPRAALEAEIDGVRYLAAHLSLDPEDRRLQADAILSIVSAAKGPVVIMGDFNAGPGSAEVRKFLRSFTDAAASAGPTHPSSRPKNRIDYIFFRGLHAIKAWVAPSNASDHCAVYLAAYGK